MILMINEKFLNAHGILVNKSFGLFYGGVFSNWYKAPFILHGLSFANSEQWMMYCKASLFKDEYAVDKILKTSDPSEVKQLGRSVKNYNDQLWKEQRYDLVKEGVFAKFDQNIELGTVLLETKDLLLVECSQMDKQWGIGYFANAPECINPSLWKGQNLLGLMLMDVRHTLSEMDID